jgi:hypothetical protein
VFGIENSPFLIAATEIGRPNDAFRLAALHPLDINPGLTLTFLLLLNFSSSPPRLPFTIAIGFVDGPNGDLPRGP